MGIIEKKIMNQQKKREAIKKAELFIFCSTGQVLLMLTYASEYDENGVLSITITNKELAAAMSLSERTIQSATKRLSNIGVITIKAQSGMANMFIIHPEKMVLSEELLRKISGVDE